jgi:hypothetical protein
MDLDGDETHFEPYDVQANEPRPDSVVYTEIFRDLQDLDTKAIALLRGPLKKSKFSNFITTGHAQSEQVIFAVAGDMKAGAFHVKAVSSDPTDHSQAKAP